MAKKPTLIGGKYIKSIVYGGLDGIITTFAVVAGVAGASLSSNIVLILGFANLIADAISMSVGDYLSSKSEKEYIQSLKAYVGEDYGDSKKKELLELCNNKGCTPTDSKNFANILFKHKRMAITFILNEKYKVFEDIEREPLKNAAATFGSFVLFGALPLASYVVAPFVPFVQENQLMCATILTLFTLFLLGCAKVRITQQKILRAGFEMVFVGGIAAASAYLIGHVIASLV